jgi:hypothetical protein
MQFYTDSDSSGSFAARFPSFSAVSSDYFTATGLSLLRGTGLSSGAGREVVVNDAMARMVWPGEEAIGKCIYLEARSNPCHRVVGVIENARQRSVIESEPSPQYYVSVDQAQSPDWASRSVLIRVDGSLQDAVSRQLTSELLNVFPQARPRVRSMMQNLEPQYRPWRLGAVLFAMSGALALAVALIGVYGSLSYTVGQRTREFGIRGALGAQSLTMIRQVLVQELRVVGIGLAIGIVMAIGAARLANQLLYDVRPLDPAILASVTLLVLLVATLAAARPAWRASRADPAQILREE